jgi:hypothetical protein
MTTSGFDELEKELEHLAHFIPGFECPKCGGEFELPLDADTVTCPHCGIKIAIEHE